MDRASTPSLPRGKVDSKAGSACSKRKSKCDGQRPICGACIVKGSDCIYSLEPGQTRTAALKYRNAALEKDLKSVMAVLGKLRDSPQDEATEYLDRLRSGIEQVPVLNGEGASDAALVWPAQSITPSSASIERSRSSVETGRFFGLESPTIYDSPPFEWMSFAKFSKVAIPKQETLELAVTSFFDSLTTSLYCFSRQHLTQLLADFLRDSTSVPPALQAEIFLAAALGSKYSAGKIALCVAQSSYLAARDCQDLVVRENPLAAMKHCNLLAAFHLFSTAATSLSYLDLGLSLGRSHKLQDRIRTGSYTRDEWRAHKKVFRTLLFTKYWLTAILGHIPSFEFAANEVALESLTPEEDLDFEDLVQVQIAKVAVLKTRVLHKFPCSQFTLEDIQSYRLGLDRWHSELPHQMILSRVMSEPEITEEERQTFYFAHLVYLSASTLLYRRLCVQYMHGQTANDVHSHLVFIEAGKEGHLAAKQSIRILSLATTDGIIAPKYWLCLFSMYTSCVVILHAVTLLLIGGTDPKLLVEDMSLARKALGFLACWGSADPTSQHFHNVLRIYFEAVQFVSELRTDDGTGHQQPYSEAASTSGVLVCLLSGPPRPGDAVLRKAWHDLTKVISFPLLSMPGLFPLDVTLKNTMISVEEISWGIHMDWTCEVWPPLNWREPHELPEQSPVSLELWGEYQRSPYTDITAVLDFGY